MRGASTVVAALALAVALPGCGAIPTDPNGTLSEVTNETLKVGVTERDPWVQLEDGEEPSGTEPALAREFAADLGAGVEWAQGAESELVEQLERGELHLVIGGFAKSTPWTNRVALTQPYSTSTDDRGNTVQHVMLVPQGENAFLLELDTFLLQRR